MKWLPAQDELLLQMVLRKMPVARIAARFGCTEQEVRERNDYLGREIIQRKPEAPAQEQSTQKLPTPEELELLKKSMNGLQLAFMDHCETYNKMGETMRHFAEVCSQVLAAEELEKVLIDCFDQPRQPGETIHQKIARTLTTRCIVIAIPGK